MDAQTTSGVSRSPQKDDFWGSMREQRLQQTEKRSTAPAKFTAIHQTTSSIPLSAEAKELEVGNHIEHERFGRGIVTAIEMSGNDRRAFVEFDSAGKKQLLLKFAKFSIVK